MNEKLAVIVLAAGQGTRMKSALPKVLHPVCGKAMAAHVLDASRELEPGKLIVVVGHEADEVRQRLGAPDVTFVLQAEQLGTAHAVMQCAEAAAGFDQVMVVNGDSPLITGSTLGRLLAARGDARMAFLSCTMEDPARLGRVVRYGGVVAEVVEADDYRGEPGPAEINAGQYVFEAEWLWQELPRIPKSAKGEYYFTGLVARAHLAGSPAETAEIDPDEFLGVDDRVRLAEAERLMRMRVLRQHMLNGVTIADPATTYIDATVRLEQDVTILQNCSLSGATKVASGSTIGPGTSLRDSTVGPRSLVVASAVEDSAIGADVHLGPFAHVRGHSTIGDGCFLGNYAEVNRSTLGRGVKMHHFSYLGDATVGDNANIAAGVITNNYDGVNKHPTVIGEGAFVGCDTMLVAPVTMGARAMTGAGTVLKQDLPPGAVAVGVPARIIRQRGEE
ncbi:MAG: bifunctional UDP-N-acetylglucosamine diphosphorylase/glucosamine-1-phosphate N-acetyltransferase GlmU [Dehalococcoidia bacterium]